MATEAGTRHAEPTSSNQEDPCRSNFVTARPSPSPGLHLAPGEQFLGEAGVMVMQSFGVTIQSQMQGGFM